MPSTVDFEIVHKGQTEPITIYVRNTLTQDLENVAGASSFRLVDISNDSTEDSGSFGATGGTKITRISTGIYQYSFNASTYPGEYILAFRLTMENEVISQDIFVKPFAAKYFAYAAQLSLQVDKARKNVSDEIENMDQPDYMPAVNFFFGYDTKHYCFYLDRGVQFLNTIPPYTQLTVEGFPFNQYGTLLIDAATIAAMESQGIFAIDTDYNYSLGGNSLVIDHWGKISGFLSHLLNRFSKTAISWKQMYRAPGTVVYQYFPGGLRSQRVLNAMPAGFWSRLLSASYQ